MIESGLEVSDTHTVATDMVDAFVQVISSAGQVSLHIPFIQTNADIEPLMNLLLSLMDIHPLWRNLRTKTCGVISQKTLFILFTTMSTYN
jgi:hypothetical protein